MSAFFIIDVTVPPGLAGVFKTVRLCSNGSVVVSYRDPVKLLGVNEGDELIAETYTVGETGRNHVVTAGAMLALDVEVVS